MQPQTPRFVPWPAALSRSGLAAGDARTDGGLCAALMEALRRGEGLLLSSGKSCQRAHLSFV